MRFAVLMMLLSLGSGMALANGGAAALDKMMLHHQRGIEQAKAAKITNTNSELDKFFDDLIASNEKELKRMDEIRNRLYPGVSPVVEVKEATSGYDVSAKIPGMNREDIKVSMLGNDLVISGRRMEQVRQEEKGAVSLNSTSSEFMRTILFDKPVDPRSMKVEFTNDGLKVHVNKKQL